MAKKETAAQRRERQRKALCGDCMEPIDLFEIRNARLLGTSYMHGCGKWLVRGGNDAVLPRSDVESNPSKSSESNQ